MKIFRQRFFIKNIYNTVGKWESTGNSNEKTNYVIKEKWKESSRDIRRVIALSEYQRIKYQKSDI